MKQITLNIKENKYSFFMDLLKKMDFVTVANDEDWFENLSVSEKKTIQKGVIDLENGNTFSHDEVITFAKQRISELKNSK